MTNDFVFIEEHKDTKPAGDKAHIDFEDENDVASTAIEMMNNNSTAVDDAEMQLSAEKTNNQELIGRTEAVFDRAFDFSRLNFKPMKEGTDETFTGVFAASSVEELEGFLDSLDEWHSLVLVAIENGRLQKVENHF